MVDVPGCVLYCCHAAFGEQTPADAPFDEGSSEMSNHGRGGLAGEGRARHLLQQGPDAVLLLVQLRPHLVQLLQQRLDRFPQLLPNRGGVGPTVENIMSGKAQMAALDLIQ